MFNLLVKSIIDEKVPSGIYNIADKQNYSYKDLILLNENLFILKFPNFLINILLLFGKIIKSVFIVDNSIKLLTSNIYNTQKIGNYINFPYSLKSLVINKEKK